MKMISKKFFVILTSNQWCLSFWVRPLVLLNVFFKLYSGETLDWVQSGNDPSFTETVDSFAWTLGLGVKTFSALSNIL